MKTLWVGTYFINLLVGGVLGLIVYSITSLFTSWGATIGLGVGVICFVVLTEMALHRDDNN